jgi:TRAP-type mannitol/chloroaromatic compound transport system substrate-binding protein
MLAYAFDKHQIDAAEFLTPAVDQRQRLQDHVKFIYKVPARDGARASHQS